MGWSKTAKQIEQAAADAYANGATYEEALEAARCEAARHGIAELTDGRLSVAVDIRADFDASKRRR